MGRGWRRAAIVMSLGLVLLPGSLLAQVTHGPRMASRAELDRLLSDLQASLPSLDREAREATEASIAAISRRLREGDIWPGDIVDLRVLGEDRWTMNHTVGPMRTISLEAIDPIDVSGVLHSELEEHLAIQLARYLREPRISVNVLKRIGVLGQVGQPGFYTTQGNSLVSEVIMLAGGPNANADVDGIEFRRLGEPLDIGPQVVWQSMSLDELGIQSGDEVYVPQGGSPFGRFLLATLGVVASISFIIWRVF